MQIKKHPGLTLMELAVVVAILAIVAGFIIPRVGDFAVSSRDTTARASLAQIRDAIMGTPDKPGYLSDTGQLPSKLSDLIIQPAGVAAFNRDTGLGWRGPYLLNANGTYTVDNSRNFTLDYSYNLNGDPALLDPWGHPIIIQHPTTGATAAINDSFTRLVSAGPNGVIDTPIDDSGAPYPSPNHRRDDIVLFLNHADNYP